MPRHPKPTMDQKIGRAARKVAEVLSDRNWGKGRIGVANKVMCTRGAITFALTGIATELTLNLKHPQLNLPFLVDNRFGLWLYENGHSPFPSVPSCNDSKAADKDEVIRLLNKFADELDPQRP